MLFSLQGLLAVLKHARREDVVLTVTAPLTLPYAVTLARIQASRFCHSNEK